MREGLERDCGEGVWGGVGWGVCVGGGGWVCSQHHGRVARRFDAPSCVTMMHVTPRCALRSVRIFIAICADTASGELGNS